MDAGRDDGGVGAMTHLEITRGDSEAFTVRLTGPGEVALDLTGGTLFWTAKADEDDDDTDAVAAAYWQDGGAADGLSVADPATGVVGLVLDALTTASIAPGQYVWDLQLVSGTGAVRTVDRGMLTVAADVTQRTAP